MSAAAIPVKTAGRALTMLTTTCALVERALLELIVTKVNDRDPFNLHGQT